ncbi:hypothetical protein [Rhodococcus daqingensis]|uniref:Secreted protein n=1 Tax=Rhodococcus daqingensis TaxID=2479363 RepID=A0ABW2RRG0_9NOCA
MAVREAPSTEPLGDDLAPRSVAPADGPGAYGRLSEFLRTTPAKLLALGIGLIVLSLISGTVAAIQVADRQRTLDTLLSQVEPQANATQNLYSALSIADAAATTAFIFGGIEPAAVRDRYTQSIGEAAADLVGASSGILETNAQGRRLLTELSTGLPVYAGLIETARAYNRSGYPVGTAYLREASSMMQSTLLPIAEELHGQHAEAVVQNQDEFATPPWLAIGLLLLSLIALVCGLVLLAGWTRRLLNPGLILATVAIAALLGWLLIAGLISSTSTGRALEQGARPLSQLTTGRILAQQARADETLGLVRRDVKGGYAEAFGTHLTRLETILAGYPDGGRVQVATDLVDAAAESGKGWSAAHERVQRLLDNGDWAGAAAVATGPGEQDSTAHFARADAALNDAIIATRTELRADIDRAHSTLHGLGTGALVLAAVAAAGVAVGLWPRLREYQ